MAKRRRVVPERRKGRPAPAVEFDTPDDADAPSAPNAERVSFLQLARDRFKQAEDADKNQRKREIDDLRFYAGDQWPEEIRRQREGQVANNGLPPVPARPCITINKTREPVRQVLNEERQSDMGIEIVAADDFGDLANPVDPAEIELREGLVRRIQRESHAADARSWAFTRAVIAGRGYYGVATRFVEGKSMDQEVYLQRFYNQAAVSLDPSHEQPDGSDAEWGFIGVDMPWDQYKAEFPKRANNEPNRVATATDSEWRALGDERPDWFQSDGEIKTVRVVDYFYTVREARELVEISPGQAEWADELQKAGIEIPKDAPSRRVIEKRVKWAKIDGCDDDVLDETDWPCPFIPIVKVMGEELQPYDKERRAEGIVRPARESNQGSNYMISKLVETIGLAPIPPWMMAAGQDEGFEDEYAVANTRTLSVLHYNQVDAEGRPAERPERTPIETPIQSLAAAFQMFSEAVRDTTGVPLSMTGGIDPSIKSGKAIRALIEQGQHGTSNFLDNLSRSITYEARIINALLKPIYGRPGRLARIVNGEGEGQTIQIGGGLVRPPGQPNAPQKTFTLTDGTFNVAIKVTKAYDTRRQQEAAELGQLLQSEPQLMTWFGDLYFKNLDGPGHQQLAERAKAMLAPPIQDVLRGGQPPPPELVQMQQQMGELQKLADKNATDLQKAQIDSQTKLQESQMEIQSKEKIAFIQASAQLAAVDAKVNAENARTFVEAIETRIANLLQAHMDRLTQANTHVHDAAVAAAQQAHEHTQAALEHDRALELASHQAALEPEPAPAS
jgi:hypothetical protein